MKRHSTLQPKQFKAREVLDLFNESAAGIAISGDSGTGKSNAMLVLMQALVGDIGMTVIDPDGDLAQDFERACAALPRRLRRRLLIVRPSDLSNVVALNPLYVPDQSKGWLHWRAQVAAKVSHVGRVLLYALGETNFNGKPVLLKWTTRSLSTCAEHQLTIPDCRHFFDVGGEVYQALARATPDIIARAEMADLADMRPRDREELIGSTKNRFLNYLTNPVVSLTLGRPSGWIDARQLIRERYVTIVSLERGGVLRDEDVEIFANLWLSEILFAVYNLPRHERTPHVIFVDELPVFAPSFDLLTRALARIRKFQLRLVAGFQGTQLFPERTDDRLLNALISQCRTTIVFRHRNPVDAKFFGELVTLPVLDPCAEKHRLTQWQQYQDGNDVAFLSDESQSWSDAQQTGGSRSDAHSDTATESTGETRSTGSSDTESSGTSDTYSAGVGETVTRQGQALSEAVSRARNEQSGRSTNRTTGRARSEQTGTSTSQGRSLGTTRTDGTNWSTTASRGGSRTRKMTLVPRLRWRQLVTSIQLFTPDEQIVFGASGITRQPIGDALVYTAGEAPMRVRFSLATGPLDRTPKFAAKQVQSLRQEITSGPAFAKPAQILAERQDFERRLIAHLDTLAIQGQVIEVAPPPARLADDNPLLSI